jgi:hypothetical protein
MLFRLLDETGFARYREAEWADRFAANVRWYRGQFVLFSRSGFFYCFFAYERRW